MQIVITDQIDAVPLATRRRGPYRPNKLAGHNPGCKCDQLRHHRVGHHPDLCHYFYYYRAIWSTTGHFVGPWLVVGSNEDARWVSSWIVCMSVDHARWNGGHRRECIESTVEAGSSNLLMFDSRGLGGRLQLQIARALVASASARRLCSFSILVILCVLIPCSRPTRSNDLSLSLLYSTRTQPEPGLWWPARSAAWHRFFFFFTCSFSSLSQFKSPFVRATLFLVSCWFADQTHAYVEVSICWPNPC